MYIAPDDRRELLRERQLLRRLVALALEAERRLPLWAVDAVLFDAFAPSGSLPLRQRVPRPR